jgi:tetratricopeptide (TPR) repeat protein
MAARSRVAPAVIIGALLVSSGAYLLIRRANRLPAPGSPVYEDLVRTFYRGLASLEVGLLDDAKRDFGRATEVVPVEPAAWANLALAHLRLGEFEPADAAVQRAAALAPASGEIAFLQGQLETSRGRLDQGIADFRRAIQLDPASARARYALAQEVEQAGGRNADADAQQLLDDLHQRRPANLAVLVEQARLAAKRADASRLNASVAALATFSPAWPEIAREQYRALQAASAAGSVADAARATAFLRNVLVRVPAFRESLVEIKPPTELIAEPFRKFLRLQSPSSMPSPPDDTLAFDREPLEADASAPVDLVTAFSLNGSDAPAVFAVNGNQLRRIGAAPSTMTIPSTRGIAVLDWNRDFRMDMALAGPGGLRLLTQAADGTFTDVTAATAGSGGPVTADCVGVWAADLEMDGDVDLVVGVRGAPPFALRNNGDGTWRQIQPFAGVVDLIGFVWGDFDGDGDPDAALLDARGVLHVFENRQAGEFREMPKLPDARPVVALAAGDLNADGLLDIIALGEDGSIRRVSRKGDAWDEQQTVVWQDGVAGAAAGTYRLFLADLDNNGALDLVASGGGRSRAWLASGDGSFRALGSLPEGEVSGILDLNNDGRLDLIGLQNRAPVRLLSRGTAPYHWQVIRPRAQPTAGDQRVNSFGIGGDIEIRSGVLTQKQAITGSSVHFGLGARTDVEVTRIVWPNGVMQADFDRRADENIVAEQRLKGSCPWVFADDGTGLRFVTDFLWRSPLGLRINAQDTAGATQTEDRVKIRGDQLAARNGAYDLRITAELWETHFIDHASLLVVDHPEGTEVFVDERFARVAPPLTTHVMRTPHPVVRAWDDAGRDVTDLVARRDGRYLDTFALGGYQGIAAEHFVEVDLGREIPPDTRQWLVATGWIYPTDSSINVAIGQGTKIQPRGLSLEARDRSGRWVVVSADLGFPAGKNKTILIDLSQVTAAGVAHAQRLRLRTNLEVYWDRLAVADDLESSTASVTRLQPERAELRYRGFSKTDYSNRRLPEIPQYDAIGNVTQRWRDLVGYYTRFGDVRELLEKVDDRYVIMNAGDELRLSFRAPEAAAKGSTRDFVLIGDGWEKDGDYNTTFSKSVQPLPRHDRPDYEASTDGELEDDPVYRRHPSDWQTYHTRFVTPDDFLRGVR